MQVGSCLYCELPVDQATAMSKENKTTAYTLYNTYTAFATVRTLTLSLFSVVNVTKI